MSGTQHIHGSVLQLQTQILGDHGCAGQDCDVAQHILAAVAEARCLNCNAGEGAAQLVDQNGGQSLTLNVLSDDEQLLAGLEYLLEQRQQLLNVCNGLLGEEDQRLIHNSFHLLGVGNHVRRQVAAVELHTLDNLGGGQTGLGLLNGDNALGGDLIHCVCDQLADLVAAGRNCCNASDVAGAVDLLGIFLNCCNSCLNRLGNALTHYHRVCACCDILHALLNHCLSQNGCGGGTVACQIVGLGSNLGYQLSAHVLKSVLQLDILCDGNAVIGDQRSAELLVQNNVAALRTQSNLYGVSQLIDTAL